MAIEMIAVVYCPNNLSAIMLHVICELLVMS